MKQGSKYGPLYDHLYHSGQAEVTLTFAEIEALLQLDLPRSARTRRGWWSNRRSGAIQATAWMKAGYNVEEINLDRERVTFRKPKLTYTVRRQGDTVMWDADLIKALRLHAGWSQSQLAEELGVRQQTVSEWETGLYNPSRAFSKFLSVIAERAGFEYDPEA